MASAVYWRLQIRNWIWILYRHYPTRERIKRIMSYVVVYIAKGIVNLRLKACLAGILEGLRNTEIIRRFPDKLSREEMDHFHGLYQRRMFRSRR